MEFFPFPNILDLKLAVNGETPAILESSEEVLAEVSWGARVQETQETGWAGVWGCSGICVLQTHKDSTKKQKIGTLFSPYDS